jgi:hypothetical protein
MPWVNESIKVFALKGQHKKKDNSRFTILYIALWLRRFSIQGANWFIAILEC